MPAADFIGRLRQHGIHLELAGERIRVRPKHLLTDPIRRVIREHRAELIEHLAALPLPQPVDPALVQPCPACGGGRFWESTTGWRCDTCHPRPDPFAGRSLAFDPRYNR